MAAGLRPDPLGEFERSPDPVAVIWGLLLRGGERRKGRGTGSEREKEGEWREKGSPDFFVQVYALPVTVCQIFLLM